MLKLDFQDDVLNQDINPKREYQISDGNNGNKTITDVTVYEKHGDEFGASEVKEIVRSLYDFKNNKVTFNSDGSITESLDIGKLTTSFEADGSIVSVLVDSEGNRISKKTQFEADGSIVTTVGDVVLA